MRYLLVAALFVVLIPVTAANASHESGSVVAADAAIDFGGVETVAITADITASASSTSGVFGEHAFGDGFDINYTGAVNCVNVTGSTAYISGTIITSNRADIPVGTPFVAALYDGATAGQPDMVSPVYMNPGFDCATPVALEFVITSGDISVQDCAKLKSSGKCKLD